MSSAHTTLVLSCVPTFLLCLRLFRDFLSIFCLSVHCNIAEWELVFEKFRRLRGCRIKSKRPVSKVKCKSSVSGDKILFGKITCKELVLEEEFHVPFSSMFYLPLKFKFNTMTSLRNRIQMSVASI